MNRNWIFWFVFLALSLSLPRSTLVAQYKKKEAPVITKDQTFPKTNSKEEKLHTFQEDKETSEEESKVSIDVTHEVATDWVWRGQSFGGEYLHRRNNTSYSEVTYSPTYIPVARVTHNSGFYFELEANIALRGRGDRDSDSRIQSFPGAGSIQTQKLAERFTNGNFTPDPQGNSLFFDPTNNVYSDACDLSKPGSNILNSCYANPIQIRKYNEKNGMARTDGLFTTFAYQMPGGKFGDFTAGTWWYFKKDRSSKFAWNEFFLWWDLPFAKKILHPSLQTFTQASYDVGGGYGNQYTSFSVSHTFFEDKKIQIELTSSIGYQWVNNNVSKKSGINDITTSIRFLFQDYFFSLNVAHRPDIYLYDNSRFYYTNSLNSADAGNFSERDGRTVDPSKLYGMQNEITYAAIQGSGLPAGAQSILREGYQSQSIPRNIFWLSLGVNQSF